MEARIARVVSFSTLFVGCLLLTLARSEAAGYKTRNFVVSAPTPQLAKEIGDQAEIYRHDLAIEWIGQELPAWSKPCPINAKVDQSLGAGGATSFVFDRGEVYGWKMNIQGSHERILDSVLPHEVTHTIFASYFRQPLPRWADEGACTTMEDRSEIAKQERNLINYLHSGRGIPFSQMFMMKEYPQDVMPLYAQGHSLSEWLIESRGRKEFLNFLADGMKDENWQRAIHEHYGFDDLLTLQTSWNEWVKQGRPQLTPATSPIGQLVSNVHNASGATGTGATPGVLRLQSPDPAPSAAPYTLSEATRPTSVTVASGSGSVYAAAAERAERERKNPVRTAADAAIASNPSVYDASQGGATMRR
jgi:hypothetical protein